MLKGSSRFRLSNNFIMGSMTSCTNLRGQDVCEGRKGFGSRFTEEWDGRKRQRGSTGWRKNGDMKGRTLLRK